MLTVLFRRTIFSLVLAGIFFVAASVAYAPLGYCATCFFEYEEPAGMNKICYYSCITGRAAITISSVQLCPLTINR